MVNAKSRQIAIIDETEPYQHIKVAKLRQNAGRTAPHKHNKYIELILMFRGSGRHTIDDKSYMVNPPVLFVIRAEQIHYWSLDKEMSGYILIIKKQFINNSIDKSLKELLFQMSMQNCIYLKEAVPIATLFELLLAEWRKPAYGSRPVIEGLLKAIFGASLEQLGASPPRGGAKAGVYRRFEEMLQHTDALYNSVAHYALLLNTTPQNLNASCRRTVGEPATSILATHLLGEAKRLLLYTDLTVGEIAIQLNFKDSSHFIKYFRRHLGTTPRVFRQLR